MSTNTLLDHDGDFSEMDVPDGFKKKALDELGIKEAQKELKVIQDFLTIVPDDQKYNFYIYRLRRVGGRGPKTKFMVAELENEWMGAAEIQDKYGGGEFVLYIKFFDNDGKPKTFTRTLNIEGDEKIITDKGDRTDYQLDPLNMYEKGKQSMLEEAAKYKSIFGGANGGNEQMMAMMMQNQQQSSQMMMQMMNQSTQMMATMMSGMMGTMGKVMEVKANGGGTNPSLLLETFKSGMDLGAPEPEEKASWWESAGKVLGSALGAYMGGGLGNNGNSEDSEVYERPADPPELTEALQMIEAEKAIKASNNLNEEDYPEVDPEEFVEENIDANQQADEIIRSEMAKTISPDNSEPQTPPPVKSGDAESEQVANSFG